MKWRAILGVAVTVALLGGCPTGSDPNSLDVEVEVTVLDEPNWPMEQQSPPVDQVEYPLFIVEPDLICVAYGPGPDDVFCDSDCDGWFDEFDEAPCDPSIPAFAPEEVGLESAGVCEMVFGEPWSPPAFASGHVFSFLTPEETQFFERLEGTVRDGINRQIRDEMEHEVNLAGARGLSSEALDAIRCEYSRRNTEMLRAATILILRDTEAAFGRPFLPLSPEERQEVGDYNCTMYPNSRGGSCVINLPCY